MHYPESPKVTVLVLASKPKKALNIPKNALKNLRNTIKNAL